MLGDWHRVTVRLIHTAAGGPRMVVRSPEGQRTLPYAYDSADPFLTAVLEAYGRDRYTYVEQLTRSYRRRVYAIGWAQLSADADRLQRAIHGGTH